MTNGRRQRRDGSSKRVQLTSGDHGGPKDKKSKGRRSKTISPGGQAARAAGLREIERFRESIRAAEQRRTARRNSTSPAPLPADNQHQMAAEEHAATAEAHAALHVHLERCLQAVQDHDWSLLKDSASQLSRSAAFLEATAESG
ncbi:hypothetical protein ACIQB5_50220 [Streptomyces sp. NPDC088560]|uniref:hypothetical protein n=1 Tax=Streptomyces sp. NPDC088560 TaxID=3365868 RepID=UPI003810FEDD